MNAIATVTWQTLTGKPCCQVDAGCIGVAIVSKATEIGTWKYTTKFMHSVLSIMITGMIISSATNWITSMCTRKTQH